MNTPQIRATYFSQSEKTHFSKSSQQQNKKKSRVFSLPFQRLHVFPRLAEVACFPALGRGCMFSRAWQRLHVFPHFAEDARFPRLAGVACFPTTSRGCIFSRDWQRLHVFSRYDTSCILPIQLLKKQMTQSVDSPLTEIPFR